MARYRTERIALKIRKAVQRLNRYQQQLEACQFPDLQAAKHLAEGCDLLLKVVKALDNVERSWRAPRGFNEHNPLLVGDSVQVSEVFLSKNPVVPAQMHCKAVDPKVGVWCEGTSPEGIRVLVKIPRTHLKVAVNKHP